MVRGAWEQGQCLENWFGFNGEDDHFGEKDGYYCTPYVPTRNTEYGVWSYMDLGGPSAFCLGLGSVALGPLGLGPGSLRAGAMWLDLISTRGHLDNHLSNRAR